MGNRDKYFKGQQDHEDIIFFMRNHWVTILKDIIFFLLFIAIIIFTVSNMGTIQEMIRYNPAMKLLFLTLFLGGTIFMHRFFVHLMNFFVNVAILTNIRFIDHKKTLFFKDSMDAIDMGKIQNVERVGEGFWPNVLGYGHIKIFLTASAGVKTFLRVPNAKFHFRCISRQKEARLKEIQDTKKASSSNQRFQQQTRV